MPKRPNPRWERRHEGILLWLRQNPAGTLKECAAASGYSASQVSRITCSPDFQRHYRVARKVMEEEVSKSVIRAQSRD